MRQRVRLDLTGDESGLCGERDTTIASEAVWWVVGGRGWVERGRRARAPIVLANTTVVRSRLSARSRVTVVGAGRRTAIWSPKTPRFEYARSAEPQAGPVHGIGARPYPTARTVNASLETTVCSRDTPSPTPASRETVVSLSPQTPNPLCTVSLHTRRPPSTRSRAPPRSLAPLLDLLHSPTALRFTPPRDSLGLSSPSGLSSLSSLSSLSGQSSTKTNGTKNAVRASIPRSPVWAFTRNTRIT